MDASRQCLWNSACKHLGCEFLDPVTLDHSSQGRTETQLRCDRYWSLADTFPSPPAFPMCVCVCVRVCVRACMRTCMLSRVWLCYPMVCSLAASFVHGILQNSGVGCHFLLVGIFSTQESNLHLLHLLHWQMDSSPLHQTEAGKSQCLLISFVQLGSGPQTPVCQWDMGKDLLKILLWNLVQVSCMLQKKFCLLVGYITIYVKLLIMLKNLCLHLLFLCFVIKFLRRSVKISATFINLSIFPCNFTNYCYISLKTLEIVSWLYS